MNISFVILFCLKNLQSNVILFWTILVRIQTHEIHEALLKIGYQLRVTILLLSIILFDVKISDQKSKFISDDWE